MGSDQDPDRAAHLDEIAEAVTEALERLDLPGQLAADGIRVVVALDAEGNVRHYATDELVKDAEEPADEAAAEALVRRVLDERGLPTDPPHDHSAENAVIAAFEDPTPENQHAAENAVAALQRRHDHTLSELAEAKRIGRWLYDALSPGTRHVVGDVSEWPWLLDRDDT